MDKKLVTLISVFFIVFLGFVIYLFTDGSIAQFTRADITTEVSLQKSLIFAWPLTVTADGNKTSEITVFVRNENGDGVPEKIVKITSPIGTVQEGELQTGDDGKVIFHISSSTVGVAEIAAFVNNRRLPRKITVQFN